VIVLRARATTPGSVSTMLDRRFIRDNPEAVRAAVRVKGIDLDVDALLSLDRSSRELQREVDEAQTRRKAFAKEFAKADEETRVKLRAEHDEQDQHLKEVREQLAKVNEELEALLLLTPMIPWSGAPVGADDSANVTIRTWGEPPVFDFEIKDHVELLENRGWAEFARARKVSGERAYALTGDMVLLERALLSYALDHLIALGSTVISVPVLVREEALIGTGQFPAHREETYSLPADDLYLAGTAEVALVGLHAGEILDGRTLPIRYAGISPCFRREAGSAGRDVRGLIRIHQFEKVEQFVICAADDEESDRWHFELLGAAEHLLQGLGLPYEVVECATGDMGAGKYRMNDVNTWFPSLGKYRETHSCSSLHDWQARRASIRYRDADGTVRFAYTLNNTAIATPRLLAALVENYQTAEAKVRVPKALVPYLGGRTEL
jgi:seryl-tRNA synthetase